MKEKTIQQEIFKEIRRRDGITYADIADRVGISEDGVSRRMREGAGFNNFVQMIEACGYNIVLIKAKPGETPGVHYGDSACESCQWKEFAKQIVEMSKNLDEETE